MNESLIFEPIKEMVSCEQKYQEGLYRNCGVPEPNHLGSFLKIFTDSQRFLILYRQAINQACRQLPDEQRKHLVNRRAGRFFEEMVYFTHAAYQPADRILLPSERTFELYSQHLYPEPEFIQVPAQYFSPGRIFGISVPDMMAVEISRGIPKIMATYEATLAPENFDLISKAVGVRKAARRAPRLFIRPTTLFVVVPKDSAHLLPQPELEKYIEEAVRIIPVEMPINCQDFSRFHRWVQSPYRLDESSATLDEIQQYVRQKYDSLNNIQPLHLPPGVKDYLSRNRYKEPTTVEAFLAR